MTTERIRTAADELVALTQRVRYMQWARLAVVAGVTGFAAYAPETVGAGLGTLARGAGVYLFVSLLAEAAWRGLRARSLFLFGAMLIVDGVFLAWLAYATGGVGSSLLSLVLLHLIAVTLLASYRTGLKLAMWHSLLLLGVYYAQEAVVRIPGIPSPPPLPPAGFHRLVGFVGVFWLVALATSAFSAVNERELRRRRYDLEALAGMARAFEGDERDAPSLAHALLESLADTFDFRRGVVLGSEDETEVTLLATYGTDHRPPEEGGEIDRVVADAWERRATLLASELDPRRNPFLSGLLPGVRNCVVVPLTAEGRSVGAVVVEQDPAAGTRIERRVVSMVERFCSHAALALRNAMLVEQLRILAAVDGLTRVANRHTFESRLEQELARSERSGEPVSLVMLDIDHFKHLNDTHGHRVGDEVLRQVAMALKGECREFDLCARYGGEEFAILLPGCAATDAVAGAERFRHAVEVMVGTAPVTASAGVATYPDHARDLESLVKRSDAALYESKRAGRNRVSSYREPEIPPRPAERARHWDDEVTA